MVRKLKDVILGICCSAITLTVFISIIAFNFIMYFALYSQCATLIREKYEIGETFYFNYPDDLKTVLHENPSEITSEWNSQFFEIGQNIYYQNHSSQTTLLQHFYAEERPEDDCWYFVILSKDGDSVLLPGHQCDSESMEEVERTISQALGAVRGEGIKGKYFYLIERKDDMTLLGLYDYSWASKYLFHRFFLSLGIGMLVIFLSISVLCALIPKILKPVLESSEQQIQFMSGITHELKTPLAIISTNADLLDLNYGENAWTGNILHQVDRMNLLLKNLMTMICLEFDEAEFPESLYPIGKRVMEEIDNFALLFENRLVQVDYQVDETLIVKGHPGRLDQMLIELMTNAAKYTPDGGFFTVSCVKNKNNIQLSFWNTVSEEMKHTDMMRLFDRFYRGDASRSKKVEGFGMGLSVVGSIVKKHGGRIHASHKGEGVCFEIVLPIEHT